MYIRKYIKEILYPLRIIQINQALFWVALIINSLMFPGIQVLLGFAQKSLVNSIEFNNPALITNVYILAGIIFVFFAIINPYMGYLNNVLIHHFTKKLRKTVYTHVLNMPTQFFDDKHSGELISRFTNDLNNIPQIYTRSLHQLLLGIFYGVGSIISMLFLCWQLAIFIFILGIFETWLLTRFSEQIRKISLEIQAKIGLSNERFIDLVQGFRTIKLFSLSQLMLRKYQQENERILTESIERNNKIILLDVINTIFASINLLGVLSVGAIMVKYGYIDLGSVMAFIIIQDGVTYMFGNLSTFFPHLQILLASSQRVFEILNEPLEVNSSCTTVTDNSQLLEIPSNGIYINNLTFYRDSTGGEAVLKNLTCKIESGKITGIIGSSGCGKTTLLKILLGLYQPQAGEIYLNGRSYSDYTITEIREHFSYVSQFPFLSHDSIEENIRFGNTSASTDQIITAAKSAYADGFIKRAVDGYQTIITEQGVNLSGGEKQRIALARAICRDAKIMILDEATTGLDSESETYIHKALENIVKKGYTVIIVAHRLSTIKNCEQIILLDNGRVIQQGTYHELEEQIGAWRE